MKMFEAARSGLSFGDSGLMLRERERERVGSGFRIGRHHESLVSGFLSLRLMV